MKHFVLAVLLVIIGVRSTHAYDFEVDGIYYNVVSFTDFTCEVTSGTTKYAGDVIIPSKVKYNNRELSVTSIGVSAFEHCDKLTSIVIPNSVTSIGHEAFDNCSDLKSVEIPNSVTSIGMYAFGHCISLTSIVIPNSITRIEDGTFSECYSLSSIVIPNSVTSIRYRAFNSCKSLSSLNIPNSVSYIGAEAFDDCGIKSLITDCNLSSSSWSSLSHIYLYLPIIDLTFGKNTKSVELNIARYYDLTKLVCHATTPPTGLTASNKQYMELEVKVPMGCLEAYQSAEGWKNFWNMSEMDEDESSVETVIADTPKTEIARYNLQGHKVGDDYRGLVIVKYSDGSTAKMINQ
ncbi:MAG: leucine-rich repeat domain-containing protein [Bacteroides sp.]|nr:leucine-rich repeat domain-containing protein [Bacteroides sp.]